MTQNKDEFQKKIEELENRITKLESLFKSESQNLKKQFSIKEFYLSKNPKDDIQKTLLFAYFLEKYNDFKSINTKDIENACKEARVNIPLDNIPYKLYKNVEKGFLMEIKEKKENQKSYILTITGEKFVDDNFLKPK